VVTLPDGKPAANYVVNEYPAGSPVFASKVSAVKAIQHEQRLEFAMEGHRFFDLVRWGIAGDYVNSYLAVESKKRLYLNGATFVKGKHEYFPLPVDEINNSFLDGKATLKQNPGY
jgi:hypothetical protein